MTSTTVTPPPVKADFSPAPFAARRQRLMTQMLAKGGGIAIIPTAPEAMRNADVEFPYRHDSSFFYLTGFAEPEAVLVLIARAEGNLSILFCRDKNLEREIWEGFRYGPAAACELFGFDKGASIDTLDRDMVALMANRPAVYYAFGSNARLDERMRGWLGSVRGKTRSGMSAPAVAYDLAAMLGEMRLVKDVHEIATMQRAARIASEGHARAMRLARPGLHEYQLEAELLHEFRYNGAQFPSYTSIVATGANACVLHYRAGDAVLRDGDMVLIDAGCELDSYASDITRTFPANGVFSGPQKELYEIVLASQYAAIAAIAPGQRFSDPHNAALKVLSQGMLDTGLLDTNKVGSLDDVIANKNYSQFYMHYTGHWLGMDVHDVGDHMDAAGENGIRGSRSLQPGMVLTVEPGLYVRPAEGVPEKYWNIGIRIEDDALVGENGCVVLSDAPKTVAEIEAIMKR